MGIFTYILFIDFIFALNMAIRQLIHKDLRKYPENRLFSALCFASAVWSFGFWGIRIQTVPEQAHLFRIIGMIGTFAYLSLAQVLFCQVLGSIKKYIFPICAVTAFSYVICFFICQPGQVIYTLGTGGMTYSFAPSLWNNIYTIYCIVIACNLLATILYLRFASKLKRMRALASKLLFMITIMAFGMTLDTILPLFGFEAIPGSTLGQFVAMLALQNALNYANRSRITIDNMPSYVYTSFPKPVLVYDSKFTLQIQNDIAPQFFGLNKVEIQSFRIDELFDIDPDEVFDFSENYREIDTHCNANDMPCNLSISKIHDDYMDVIGHIVIVTDLTERMENIARLERAIQEAENANQSKTIFLANMSHEIRTPMNAIIGFAELAGKKNTNKEIREYIDGIRLSSRNLLAIINDILDITKIESGKMEIIPADYYVADLLDDVSLIISQQAKQKGLSFFMKTDETIPTKMFGDKVRIRGVLINILNNAVKYTNEGSVTFETKVISRTDDNVKLGFIISDTGIGIREENMGNLFKSFERLDQQINYGVEGSGLGLSIAKGYVTLMGGEISVESVYGQGSTFTVKIDQKVIDPSPMHHRFTIDRVSENPEPAAQLVIRDTRVLLVDDNRVNLMVAKGLLASYGLTVDTASGGAEAIELCKKTHYPIVFLDQMMPGMDGIETMKRIRYIDDFYTGGSGGGRIVALTANAIRGTRQMLIDEGFDEYLGKPMNLKQVERVLVTYIPADKVHYEEPSAPEPEEEEVPEESGETEETKYLTGHLPNLDVSIGLKNCGGKVKDFLSILKINYTYGEKNLKELEELLNRKDYENYTIKVHAMKSTTAGIGAMEVSTMARKQEEAGKQHDYAYIDANFEQLRTAYIAQLKQIREVLCHFGELDEAPVETDAPMLDQDMISNILLNIKNHLDSFDFAKVFDILDDVRKYRLSPQNQELFSQIASKMDNLDVDTVRALIEEQHSSSTSL